MTKMGRYGRFTGKEDFILDGNPIEESIVSFWCWAYSELDSNIVRSVLAEYIVAIGLGITKDPGEEYRKSWRPYDLMYSGIRIEVKSASNVQTWNTVNRGKYTFTIAPASLPDPVLGYVDDAPKQRNCDIYVFCIFEPKDENIPPLNLNAWRFLVLPTSVLDEMSPTQKTIGIKSLESLNPQECRFNELQRTVDEVIKDIKAHE